MSNGKSRRRLSLDSFRSLTQSHEKRKSQSGYESDSSSPNSKRSSIFQKLVTPGNSSKRASIAGVQINKTGKQSQYEIASKGNQKNGLSFGEKTSILECINFLNEEPHVLEAEGIFRSSGSFSQMQNLRTRLMQGYKIPRSCRHNGGNVPDPLTVADLLKDLLRNLESSLLPKETGRQLLSTQQSNKGLSLLHVTHGMHEDNKEVFEDLMQLLAKTASLSLFNHMNSKNIATIFAPTLIKWDPLQSAARTELQAVTEAVACIIDDYMSGGSVKEEKRLKTRKHHSMPLHLQPNPFYNPPKYLPVSKRSDYDAEKENRLDGSNSIRSVPKIRDSRKPKEIIQWKPLSDEERTSFDASFHAVDITDKGCISASEGIAFLSKFSLSLEQVALIWNLVDTNDSGVLGIREWRVAMALCMGLNRNCQIPTKLPAVLEQELTGPIQDSSDMNALREAEIPEGSSIHLNDRLSEKNCNVNESVETVQKLPQHLGNDQNEMAWNIEAHSIDETIELQPFRKNTESVGEPQSYDDALESIRWLWIETAPVSKNCYEKLIQEMPHLDPLTRRKLLGRGFHQ